MHDGNTARDFDLSNSSASTTNAIDDAAMVGAVAKIVASYVAKNAVAQAEVPALIATVHRSLASLAAPPAKEAKRKPEPLRPPVPIKRSITPEHLICLEDGRKFKALKRHLRTTYSMTPDQYREKWGLPPDYPMVAPNYAKQRSELAKNMGLGNRPRTRSSP